VSGYRLLLLILGIALLAAAFAALVGSDPGYMLIEFHGWALETSAVLAVFGLLLVVGLIWLLGRLVTWPMRAAEARARRRGRVRHVRGVVALAEGRPRRAGKLLLAASRLRSLRIPGLLGAFRAAESAGDGRAAGELLAKISNEPDAMTLAKVLHAERELADGRAGTVIELLQPLERNSRLPPAGRKLLADALCARGRAREALAHALLLRRKPPLPPPQFEAWCERVAATALTQANDALLLESLWRELPRPLKRRAAVVLALSTRAADVERGEFARAELEGLLKREWNEAAAEAYGRLKGSVPQSQLKVAEGWLATHPASPALNLALARLCRTLQLWGKAEDYLHRALAFGAGIPGWEELGRAFLDQGDAERAARAYANAVAVAQGERPAALSGRASREDFLAPVAVPEVRDQHGVPRLPEPAEAASGANSKRDDRG
jgi:HemY protein